MVGARKTSQDKRRLASPFLKCGRLRLDHPAVEQLHRFRIQPLYAVDVGLKVTWQWVIRLVRCPFSTTSRQLFVAREFSAVLERQRTRKETTGFSNRIAIPFGVADVAVGQYG